MARTRVRLTFPASLVQEPWTLLESVAPEDRDEVIAALERQGRGEPTDVEYRILRPDGSLRWIRDRSFPIQEVPGQVSHVASVADDITERKQAEQAQGRLALFQDSESGLYANPRTRRSSRSRKAASRAVAACCSNRAVPQDQKRPTRRRRKRSGANTGGLLACGRPWLRGGSPQQLLPWERHGQR